MEHQCKAPVPALQGSVSQVLRACTRLLGRHCGAAHERVDMVMMRGRVIGWKTLIQVSQIAAKHNPTPPVPDDGLVSDELPAVRHMNVTVDFEGGLTWANGRELLLGNTDDSHS